MKTCPYCGNAHNNQEFTDYCDIDCAMAARRDYNRACKALDMQQREKRKDELR